MKKGRVLEKRLRKKVNIMIRLVRLVSRWIKGIKGIRGIKGLSRCPVCGYYAFNGVECFDCGYRVE